MLNNFDVYKYQRGMNPANIFAAMVALFAVLFGVTVMAISLTASEGRIASFVLLSVISVAVWTVLVGFVQPDEFQIALQRSLLPMLPFVSYWVVFFLFGRSAFTNLLFLLFAASLFVQAFLSQQDIEELEQAEIQDSENPSYPG